LGSKKLSKSQSNYGFDRKQAMKQQKYMKRNMQKIIHEDRDYFSDDEDQEYGLKIDSTIQRSNYFKESTPGNSKMKISEFEAKDGYQSIKSNKE
jgi:hypothetical protein